MPRAMKGKHGIAFPSLALLVPGPQSTAQQDDSPDFLPYTPYPQEPQNINPWDDRVRVDKKASRLYIITIGGMPPQ